MTRARRRGQAGETGAGRDRGTRSSALARRLTAVVARLPAAGGSAQVALAELAGELWYRVAPARGRQARREPRAGSSRGSPTSGSTDPRIRAAATDPRGARAARPGRVPARRALLPRGGPGARP